MAHHPTCKVSANVVLLNLRADVAADVDSEDIEMVANDAVRWGTYLVCDRTALLGELA